MKSLKILLCISLWLAVHYLEHYISRASSKMAAGPNLVKQARNNCIIYSMSFTLDNMKLILLRFLQIVEEQKHNKI